MLKPPQHEDGAQSPSDAPRPPKELKTPSPQALRRAAPLFAQLMGVGRGPSKDDPQNPSLPASQALPARSYPVAARLLAQVPPPPGNAEQVAPTEMDQRRLLHKTPPWAAKQGFVRASPRGPKAAAVPQVLLEEVADAALITDARGDEGPSFTIQFREDLLGELRCRLHMRPTGEMVATFEAVDANTRRLLLSEAGRLRNALEAQGLRRITVQVQDL